MVPPGLQNFLLATVFENGGIATLISALSALYQMTFAGFFVHLNTIPPVLRWLQWLCPLKYALEALCVNEVGSGLMIVDTLEGVPVNISASLMMNLVSRSRSRSQRGPIFDNRPVALRLLYQRVLPRCPCVLCLHRGICRYGRLRGLDQNQGKEIN